MAFDMVDHPTLLKKLYPYGIRGNAFNWFKTYLSERSQYVVYDSKQSKTQTVKCGVPQGSVLGSFFNGRISFIKENTFYYLYERYLQCIRIAVFDLVCR